MSRSRRLGSIAALCALLAGSGSVFAQGKLPQGQFVCQVEDANSVTRFIGVQADSIEDAEDIVQGKSKWPVPAGRSLIECITPDTQRFKSGKAQKAYMEEAR